MKAKWTEIVGEASGSFGEKQYVRHIPGNDEWAAVCTKPELSKQTKRRKAELPVAQNFKQLIETCRLILHDANRRAEWQVRFEASCAAARKHGKKSYGRLCDYVRHEVSEALKRGEPIG